MRIYLDLCCLKRPFDLQDQPLVRLQTEAVLSVLSLPSQAVQLIHSEAHALENSLNTLKSRRDAVDRWIVQEPLFIAAEPELTSRTAELITAGFKGFDALHLASAELAHADVLLTVDLKFLKQALRVAANLRCRVNDPIALVEELSQWKH